MRAIVFEEFGEPDQVLKLQDVPETEPEPGEVLVRMLASPINPSDLMSVRGIYGSLPTLPATPGFEGVGIVEENGGGLLGKFLQGKRVAVLNKSTGNWREKTVIPAKQAIPLPQDLPLEQAAMFFVNPATAFVMTHQVLKIPSGQWLLQTAAGSAVGQMVIRLGQRYGFRTLNVVRRAEQIDELKAMGANAVITFDDQNHEPEQFRQDVMLITEDKGVPFAIDPVGGITGSQVVKCLAVKGRMLVYGTLSDDPLSFSSRDLMTQTSSLEGFWLSRWMDRQKLLGKISLVRKISQLMREFVLVSDVGKTYSLDQIADAVRESEKPGRDGKVLLQISEE